MKTEFPDENDVLIGCVNNYHWNTIKYWINSINMTGFKGHKILVAFNMDKETVEKVGQSGFKIIASGQDNVGNLIHQSNMPVHVERFFHIWLTLEKMGFERKPRNIITTDVKDVVFQTNPFKKLDEFLIPDVRNKFYPKMIASSENMRYKDEPWGRENFHQCFGQFFYEHYKDKEIDNVGVLAGDFDTIKDLCLQIFQMSLNRPISIVDQAVYNFLLLQQPWKDITHFSNYDDLWAVQAGTTNDPNKLNEFKPLWIDDKSPAMNEEGLVVNNVNELFPIVHQWDRVPEWREKIEKKYG